MFQLRLGQEYLEALYVVVWMKMAAYIFLYDDNYIDWLKEASSKEDVTEIAAKNIITFIEKNKKQQYNSTGERIKTALDNVATPLDALLVPRAGLEPARESSLPPQDSVSTTSTTSAQMRL